MFDQLPEHWKEMIEALATPIAWIPAMQQALLDFFLDSSSVWIAAGKYILMVFPALLMVSAVWCTQLSIYTLPFRSGRVKFITMILLAWWDAARAVWLYWVGLFRVVTVAIGWLFTLVRLAVRLITDAFKQILFLPFAMTGKMTKSYFQPGVPWIAFLMLIGWCLLEALIFTYTLYPTVSEVLADLAGSDAPAFTGPVLFLFLFLLIMGSFACLQVLFDIFKRKEYKFLVQMIVVELFVMFFEVMFLYRELVDAITPWIAQQTGEEFRMGIVSTLALAAFGWVGVRGMTWFLFGQFGTPPLLAFISRKPMAIPEGVAAAAVAAEAPAWWRAPVEDFKREIGWLHEKSQEMLEYLSLPALHVLAAALNFAMILVASYPVFSIPFKNLKAIMEPQAILAQLQLQSKKVNP
ncbi:MAG TPA: hypothetical protein VLY20_05435 [Nitrospiria bacterium]|nr:hypothetical protein [Nitrospiria bacterium]